MKRQTIPVNGTGRVETPADQIFAEPNQKPRDFKFDSRTAGVFDDMVSRSVPFYDEIQRMTGELAADFAVPGRKSDEEPGSLGCVAAPLVIRNDAVRDLDHSLLVGWTLESDVAND